LPFPFARSAPKRSLYFSCPSSVLRLCGRAPWPGSYSPSGLAVRKSIPVHPTFSALDLFFLRSDFSTPETAALVSGSLRPLAKTRSPLSSSWFCCPPPRRFSFGSLFSVRVGAPCQVRLLFWPPPARSGLPLPICFTATDFPCLAVWVSMFGPRVQELAL
jgi:hypothetical protein